MDAHSNNPNLSTKPNKPSPAAAVFSEVPAGHHQRPIGPKKKKKQRWWFPNCLAMKKHPSVAAATKTFPIDSSSPPAEEPNGGGLNGKTERDKKLSDCFLKSRFNRWKTNCIASSRKRQRPPAADTIDERLSSAPTTAAEVRSLDGASPVETTVVSTESSEQKNTDDRKNGSISQDRRDVEVMKSVVTCKKRLSFCKKKLESNGEKTKSRSRTHSGCPVQNDSVLVPRTTTPELHRILPRRAPNNIVGDKKDRSSVVVGMSIIAVALAIVVVWGRLCAVVCTSVWLYFVPRLRTFLSEVKVKANRGENSGGASVGRGDVCGLGGGWSPDYESAGYKRRVVLEGFLERNRRP